MAKSVIDSSPIGKTPKQRRSTHDAGLLFCCMDVLQIDHNKLAQDEPLLHRELQGVCTLCPNKRDCAFDLAGGFDGMRWDEWWLPQFRNADDDRRIAKVPSSAAL